MCVKSCVKPKSQMHQSPCDEVERDVAQCVELPLEVRWVVGSIPLSGPIKLFLVPASAPQLV